MKRLSVILLALVLCLSAVLPMMPQQQDAPLAPEVEAATYETAWWPAPTMRITQIAYESYSHGSQNALDYAPGGRVFAPFTGKITYKDANWGYVVFQSSDKVYFANGTLDYMTVTFMHDSNISDLYVGQVISQGTNFYDQGGMGNGNANAYAYHVHMGVYKGHVAANSGYGNGNIYAYQALAINTAKTTSIANQGVMASGNYTTNGAPTNYTGLWKNVSQVQSGPPTTATVTTANKDSFAVNENVTFNMTSNGDSNTLWIYKPDGTSTYYQNAGTSKTLTFSTAGKYQALVEAWNGEGSKCSSKITFYVGNPTTATVKTNKSSYTTGENVTFTMSSDGASNTLWIYSPDGKSTYYQNAGTSKTLTFSTAGTYQALVEAWNGVGSKCSSKISFTVTQGSTTTTTTTTTTGKPTSATIKSDKSSYLTGENVVLTFSGNGDSNTLWIYKPDGTSTYYQNAGTTKTLTFSTAGTYGALVETWNGVGSYCSTKITFTVTAPSKPTSATIKSDKSSYTVGESVKLTFSGNGDSNTLWIYKPDGTSEYFEKAGTSKTMTFTTPGTYGALVETWNGVGSFCSTKITFTVKAATTATTTKATTTATTTKATTTATTTKATTTVTTTKATTTATTTKTTTIATTTASTTAPTTQSTTVKPTTTKATTTKVTTTASTTQPTTVEAPTISTAIYDCAVNGHNYMNGYCRICKEMDPEHVATTTAAPTEAPTTEAPAADNAGANQQNKNDTNWWPLILVVLLGGLGLAIMAVVLLKKK